MRVLLTAVGAFAVLTVSTIACGEEEQVVPECTKAGQVNCRTGTPPGVHLVTPTPKAAATPATMVITRTPSTPLAQSVVPKCGPNQLLYAQDGKPVCKNIGP